MAIDIGRRQFISALGGASVALPLAARAQQPAMPMIGFMCSRSPEDSVGVLAAFRRGLSEGGRVEGKNVVIEFRWARGEYAQLPQLAAELLGHRLTVLVAVGAEPAAMAAKAATTTIPIIFTSGDNPMKSGLVESLNRPGSNATGVAFLTTNLEPKRISLLHELFPAATLFGALLNPTFPPAAQQELELTEAARTLGQPVIFLNASNDAELEAAFATLARRRVVAMLVTGNPFFDTRRNQIIAYAAQQKLPAIYHFREYTVAGGLMSYGPSLPEAYHQVGIYAARILDGAKAADLPVVQSLKFELVINLKAAKAIGFEFPPTFSALADEVIE